MGNTTKWCLSSSEVGKAVGSYNSKAKTFRVYIAKILPLVKFAKAKAKNVTINKNCFLNSSTCKPSMATHVKSINYILVPKSNANRLSGTIRHGTQLKITVFNNNIDKLAVVSKKDRTINK